ncbi:MAG: ferrous iron transport protein A [Actinobacteria bacterium]|nr:ferrous iron transport protein A [Actinomycetota bacterium]
MKARKAVKPKLQDLKPGDYAEILGYEDSSANTPYRARLLSLGLTPHVCARVVRVAPAGDPIEIEIRGYRLSLRKAEADILTIRIFPRGCDGCHLCN